MSEFNQYDTDRDNKITEPEIRADHAAPWRSGRPPSASRWRRSAARGMMALNDLIDMQMREADKLDKNNDGKISQQEYLVAGRPGRRPADARASCPTRSARSSSCSSSRRSTPTRTASSTGVELTAYAVKEFLETDLNKDRFLDQEEIKKFQEAEQTKTRDLIPKLMPRTGPTAPAPGGAAAARAAARAGTAAGRSADGPAAGDAVDAVTQVRLSSRA